MKQVAFFVPGNPRGRDQRTTVQHGFVHVYTTARGRTWRESVKLCAIQNAPPKPFDGPLTLDLRFYLRRPQSHYTTKGELNAKGRRRRYPTTKPDLDNLAKPVKDALKGIVYLDDAQVVAASMTKKYTRARTGVMVTVTEADWCNVDGENSET